MLAPRFHLFVVVSGALLITAAVTIGAQRPSELLAWERQTPAGIEHLGIAKIERIGDRPALTVRCGVSHSVYLAEPLSPSAVETGSSYIRATYHYVSRPMANVRCPLPPCDTPTERLVVLDRVERLTATEAEADRLSRECAAATARAPR